MEEGMIEKYDVRIIRRSFQQTVDDYHATVTRRSDGLELIWTSRWLWLLKRKVRRRALERYFKQHDEYQEKLAEVLEFKR